VRFTRYRVSNYLRMFNTTVEELTLLCLLAGALGCSAEPTDKQTTDKQPDRPTSCLHTDSEQPDWLAKLGCQGDFDALASAPADASIPGARSVKTVVDRLNNSSLHFQNSVKYTIHHAFVSAHLSSGGLPPVGTLSQFNASEYYSLDRRFLLGAVSHYEGPNVWAYEIAPYDTATAEMITSAYDAVDASTFFGAKLVDKGQTVLTAPQTHRVASALTRIHT
jgi:pyruvate, water dikinase